MLARINLNPPGTGRRSAFTFIELMAVLAIALIVIALTVTASIQVLAYQRGHTTQTTLKALSDSLDRQWAAVIAAAKQETIPADVYSLAAMGASAGNQNIERRARVIWIKLRLKQEFPMNISEALFPGNLPPSLTTQPISSVVARPTYFRILRNAGYYVPAAGESQSATLPIPASVRPVPPPPRQFLLDPATWPEESSICLLMSLQQARNGFALSEDDLGSGVVMTDPISGLKMLVDSWQQPIYFYRWQGPLPYPVDPYDPGNLNNRDVDNSSPIGPWNSAQPNTFFRDPVDPEGMLLDQDWNNYKNFQTAQGVWWFELYCHPVHENVPGGYSVRSYYTIPVLVSGGRNTRRGLLQMGTWTNPMPPPVGTVLTPTPYIPQFQGLPVIPPGLFPSPLLPDLMDVDPGDLPRNPEGANDNIYTYRLRQGTRGD